MDSTSIILTCQTVIFAGTLLLLIWQIYELRKNIQMSSFLGVGGNYIPTMLKVVEKPELGKCFKILENINLSNNEISEKFYIPVLICIFVNAYNAWKNGFYDENTWNAWKEFFKRWVGGHKFREEWNSTKDIFAKDFIEFVDNLLSEEFEQ